MPNDRRVARRPARPIRRSGGWGFWPLFWTTVLLAIIGAAAGWILASPPDVGRTSPTAAPVIVATQPAPTSPPTAAAKPTSPPTAAPKPTAPPATAPPATPSPVPPTQPPATAVPPTPVPPTQPPAKPTAPPVGMSAVPEVVGKSEADASKAIRDAGLTVKVEERRALGLRDGIVVAQNPPGGQALQGSTVTITVGRGIGAPPKPAPKEGFVLMPNVAGMDEKDARKTLEDAGFKVSIEREEAPGRKGQVIDQNPAAGDTVRPERAVRITIGS
jgi:hypothetical protein